MRDKKMNLFITVEGNEGVGKSTVVAYLKTLFDKNNCQFIMTREPGGTEIAEKIRALLLDHHQEMMADDTELLLIFAGRAQHIEKVIRPALGEGKWVVSDRFTDASFAYQGGARGIALSRIEALANWVQNDLWPNVTFLLDAPVDIAMDRVQKRGKKDRIECEDKIFFDKVRYAYLDLAKKHSDRFIVIDAAQDSKKVCYDIATIMQKRYGFDV